MVLWLKESQRLGLEAEAKVWYPQECCGVLLGRRVEGTAYCEMVWPMVNAWTSQVIQDWDLDDGGLTHDSGAGTRCDRFWIDPQDLCKAQRWARDHGWLVLGIYHSHPDHPAVPSVWDQRWAWPDYVYVIVQAGAETCGEIRGWKLEETGQFIEEPLGWCE